MSDDGRLIIEKARELSELILRYTTDYDTGMRKERKLADEILELLGVTGYPRLNREEC